MALHQQHLLAFALLGSSILACAGATRRSCPEADAACSDEPDTLSTSIASGGSATGDGTSTSGGSEATDGGSGSGTGGSGASTSGGDAGTGGAGTGGTGSGGAGTTGTGGSGGTGAELPMHTPGAYDCGTAELSERSVFLLASHYDNTIADLLGLTELDAYDGVPPSALLISPNPSKMEATWEAYRAAAEAIAEQVMSGPLRSSFLDCNPSDDGCLSGAIRDFGLRAFRRPLLEGQVAELEELIPADLADASDDTAQVILTEILASPAFILREEQGSEGNADLDSFEVASRLAYFSWAGPPNDQLLALAEAGALDSNEQLATEAMRLSDDARARRGFAEFHREYLWFSGSYWGAVEHDPQVFPAFTPAARAAALDEIEAFFDHITVSGGGFQDLFLQNAAFINRDTAPLYGLDPDAFGSELAFTELDPVQRPGFLTRVGFLSSYSGYRATNPIIRGIYVTTRILGLRPEPPSPDSILMPVPPMEYRTNREATAALTSSPQCAECHQLYIDPIGFVLENYDAVGSWQTVDSTYGGVIDPVADVFFGDRVVTIDNSFDLMTELANSKFAQRHYADAIVQYAFSRAPNPHDACLAEELADSIAQGASIKELWVQVAQSGAFRRRGP